MVNHFTSKHMLWECTIQYMYVYSGLGLAGSGQSTSQRHFSNYCFLFSSQHHVLQTDLYIMVCHFSSAFPTNPVYSKQCAAKHESKCSITWTCLRHSCCWYLPTHPTNTGTPRNVCFSWWPKVTLQIHQGIRVLNHDKALTCQLLVYLKAVNELLFVQIIAP